MDHPIQNLMKTAMENIRNMVEVDTIVGNPIHTPDGHVIIPVSKVGFGFAAGGSEFSGQLKEQSKKEEELPVLGNPKLPFGGGSGGGVSISPIGFIVVGDQGIRFLSTGSSNQMYDRVFELIDNISERWSKRKKKDQVPEDYRNFHD